MAVEQRLVGTLLLELLFDLGTTPGEVLAHYQGIRKLLDGDPLGNVSVDPILYYLVAIVDLQALNIVMVIDDIRVVLAGVLVARERHVGAREGVRPYPLVLTNRLRVVLRRIGFVLRRELSGA